MPNLKSNLEIASPNHYSFFTYLFAKMNILKNEYFRFRQKISPYVFDRKKHEGSFIAQSEKREAEMLLPFERVIYTFWTGNNPMSDTRQRAFEQLKEKSATRVQLITPQNLSDYILREHPLHPAFQNLSLVHKSDYLRCYFMHFHGGGYADIKPAKQPWGEAFDQLQNSDKWMIGYREIKYSAVAKTGGNLQKELERNFLSLIGNCAYIARPQTPFTQEWYNELMNRMDSYTSQLVKNPGNVMGDNAGYPIPWTNILGNIFHPLCLKYHDKLLQTDILTPVWHRHR